MFSFNENGAQVVWPAIVSNIELLITPDTSLDIPAGNLLDIVNRSVTVWNNKSRLTLKTKVSRSGVQRGANNLYFSDNQTIFNGSGVVGLTQVAYSEATGNIVSANVIINDRFPLNVDTEDDFYLGNVITHEVGHLLGLGHGQVHNSTMFYLLDIHQHSLSDDDIAGIHTLYPSRTAKGSIAGQIIGGENKVGIFGAHVQAISITKNKVMAAVFSDIDGRFKIDGLENDDYTINLSPAKNITMLPSYYSSIRKDFCADNKPYTNSFFQSCLKSESGYPQIIKIITSNKNVDVGQVSIKCSQDVPQYRYNHDNFLNLSDLNNMAQLPFVSINHMTKSQVVDRISDQYEIDLSNYEILNAAKKLQVSVLSTDLYFPVGLSLVVTNLESSRSISKTHSKRENVQVSFDLTSQNLGPRFFIEVVPPESLMSSEFVDDTFIEKSAYYLLQIVLLDEFGNALDSQGIKLITDNSKCVDGAKSYTVQANSDDLSGSSDDNDASQESVSCGSISDISDNTPPANGGSFVVGLLLTLIMFMASRKIGAFERNF